MVSEYGSAWRGIRLDSGDIAYLSIEARKMLDAAGFPHMQIMASKLAGRVPVRDLLVQGAQIDSFGIGERLITSKSGTGSPAAYNCSRGKRAGEIVP